MSQPEFVRSCMLYGDLVQQKLQNATVMICGVGAVGSFAVETLARVGVGNFILVDSDCVDISNINRQLCALHSTIGVQKTSVIRDRVLDINPNANIEVYNTFIDNHNCQTFVDMKPDIIIDAIDSIAPKIELCATALLSSVEIVSSMGAARKLDPTQIEVANLYKTYNCPLASRMRKQLRAKGFKKVQDCVFSKEIPSEQSHIQSGSDNSKKVIGSTPVVTSIFGIMLANLAIKKIGEKLPNVTK